MWKAGTTPLPNGSTLQVSHDFLTLRLGNGRVITTGRSGEKFTGDIPREVSDSFCAMVDRKGTPLEARMVEWATDTLPALWPAWNVGSSLVLKVGDKVTYDFGKSRSVWSGQMEGTVKELPPRKGGKYRVAFTPGVMIMSLCEIENGGKGSIQQAHP